MIPWLNTCKIFWLTRMNIESVGFECDELESKARVISQELGFKLDKDAEHCLYLSKDFLALKMNRFSLLHADFAAKTWSKRKAEGKKQGVVRACKPTLGMKIIDATAGWGKDGAILASFGAQVLLLERNPVMAALLADALQRQTPEDKHQLHVSLVNATAHSYLNDLKPSDYPDVIYIDPMHPERTKSALVKKEMQALQQMIGADDDVLELIQCAVQRVKQRVVVKWPQKSKALLPANASIEGKTIRFDIYFPK